MRYTIKRLIGYYEVWEKSAGMAAAMIGSAATRNAAVARIEEYRREWNVTGAYAVDDWDARKVGK